MSRRAERNGGREAAPRRRREFDRRWYGRIALALIVVAAIALVARVSTMIFGNGSARIERMERSVERGEAREPAPGAAAPR